MRTRIVEIDIDSSSLRILKYKQYDHNNLLKVIVKENKQFVDLSNYTIRAFFEFPNGNVLQRNTTLVDGEINILLESIVLQHCGKTSLEIVLSNGKEIVSTFTIYLDVEKSIDRNAPIEGDPIWDIIKDGLSYIDGKVDKEEFDEVLENYYTKSEVDKKIVDIVTGGSINLDGFATKEDIPTKLSDLENDSNFLTSVPSEYITDKELEDRLKNIEVDTNVDLSNYVTKNELNNKAEKSEIPTKTSQLTNDSNYISSIPKEYITENELENKNYASESFVTNKIAEAQLSGGNVSVDLSGFATKDDLNEKANKSEIPEKVSQLENDKGYLTEHQDLGNYYTKNEVDKKINDNETIQNLLEIIGSLQSQIQKLQEDVEYLKTHGGGGTIPDDDENEDVVNDGVLILEDGFELLLEDGSSILLEGNTDGGDNKEEEKDNIILLEDGFELLMENGSNFLLDVA